MTAREARPVHAPAPSGITRDHATFNGKQNVLLDAYVASLEVGDVLDDDAVNPLVYQSVSRPS